ncbi:hypothetical protein lbkm_2799 [Lachnospiraceae bacterium KM106-2]|nr:hypothetical protein lbkm_2799 [Lachnospiraceae bacterium KM106-2]
MSKKGKHNPLLLLILLMVVLVVSYIGITVYQSKESAKKSSDSSDSAEKTILKADTDKADSLSIKTANASITFVKSNKKWICKEESDRPLNQDTISSMVSTFSSIAATQTVVDKAEDLTEYGLDQPELTATLKLSDGTTEGILVGMASPSDSSSYYAKLEGKDAIYLVSSSVYTSLSQSLSSLTKVKSTPSLSDSNVKSLEVTKGSSSVIKLSYHEDQSDSDYDKTWTMDQPYGKEVAADTTNVSSFISNFTDLNYSENVDYTGKELKKYGLDQPKATVKIVYTKSKKEKTFTLLVGNQSGDYYYVQDSNSKYIYKLSSSTVENMISVDPFEYLNKTMTSLEVGDVKSIAATVSDKNITVKSSKKIKSIFNKINALEAVKAASKKVGSKMFTVKLNAKSSQTMVVYQYDDSYAAVDTGKGVLLLVDVRDVNAIQALLK